MNMKETINTGDPRETLGVSDDATNEEVKKRFKQLAAIHHPDKGGDEAEFKKFKRAYEQIIKGASEPDNVAARSMSALHACFSQLLSQVDPMTSDIVKAVRESIRTNIASEQDILELAKRDIKKYRKLLGKMTTKGEINLFEIILGENIEMLEKNIKLSNDGLKVLGGMITLLDDYTYEYEVPVDRFVVNTGAGWGEQFKTDQA